jgi:[protein-PII] uridylyltransferase
LAADRTAQTGAARAADPPGRARGPAADRRCDDGRLHRDHGAHRVRAQSRTPAVALCANIVGAHITTTRDGFALDTFLLAREFPEDEDEKRRASRIAETIDKLLRGDVRLRTLLDKRRPAASRLEAFSVEPEVIINNTLSDRFTVIEVTGRDRNGLLYDLTSSLSDLNLDIASAHITTFGEKAVDVFYVTDLTGKKIESDTRQAAIRKRLMEALSVQGDSIS